MFLNQQKNKPDEKWARFSLAAQDQKPISNKSTIDYLTLKK